MTTESFSARPAPHRRPWMGIAVSGGVHAATLGLVLAVASPVPTTLLPPLLVVVDELPSASPREVMDGRRSTKPGAERDAARGNPERPSLRVKAPGRNVVVAPSAGAPPRLAAAAPAPPDPPPVAVDRRGTTIPPPVLVMPQPSTPSVRAPAPEDISTSAPSAAPAPERSTPDIRHPEKTIPAAPGAGATTPEVYPTSRTAPPGPLAPQMPAASIVDRSPTLPATSKAALESSPITGASGLAGDAARGRAAAETAARAGSAVTPSGETSAASGGNSGVTPGERGVASPRDDGAPGSGGGGTTAAVAGPVGGGTLTARTVPGEGRAAPSSVTGPLEPTSEYDQYIRALRRQIQEVVTYPGSARRRGITGTVRVELILHPTGEVERIALLESSSHGVLDSAALEAVRAIRLRPFPPDLPRRILRIQLPIVFELR